MVLLILLRSKMPIGVCWEWALKARHDVTKLDLTVPFVIPLVYWHWFEHLAHISYIIHYLDALGVAQSIQVIGYL